jgi:hypothetical protein
MQAPMQASMEVSMQASMEVKGVSIIVFPCRHCPVVQILPSRRLVESTIAESDSNLRHTHTHSLHT